MKDNRSRRDFIKTFSGGVALATLPNSKIKVENESPDSKPESSKALEILRSDAKHAYAGLVLLRVNLEEITKAEADEQIEEHSEEIDKITDASILQMCRDSYTQVTRRIADDPVNKYKMEQITQKRLVSLDQRF